MAAPSSVHVLLLAGGINRIPLYEGYVPGYKALLPVAGKPAIQHTLEALWRTPQVRSVAIVGVQKELEPAVRSATPRGPVEFIPSGATILESVIQGLQHCPPSSMVLVTTADLPLLTPNAVMDFLAGCACERPRWAHNAFLAVVPERCYQGAYAKFTKPFNRFRDVSVCHGNLALVDPRIAEDEQVMRRFQQMYQARKNPITSALAVGLDVGLAYVLGVHFLHLLSLSQMAAIASRHFHVGLTPVVIEHPEVSIDIDEAEDYRFVLNQFGVFVSPDGRPSTSPVV